MVRVTNVVTCDPRCKQGPEWVDINCVALNTVQRTAANSFIPHRPAEDVQQRGFVGVVCQSRGLTAVRT